MPETGSSYQVGQIDGRFITILGGIVTMVGGEIKLHQPAQPLNNHAAHPSTPLKTKTETIIWYHMIMYSIDNVPDQVWKLPCVLCCAPRLYPRYPCYLSHRYFDFHWLRRWPINSSWLPRLPVFFPVCYNPCICEIQGSQRKCRAGVQLGISWDITPAYPYIPLQHLAV